MPGFPGLKFTKKSFFISFLLILSLLCLLPLSGCASSIPPNEPVEAAGFYFDTIISIRIYSYDMTNSPTNKLDEILNQCMELASHYENLLSPNIEDSDIWKINHSDGTWVRVNEDTLALLKTSLNFAKASDGMVTPVIGALSQLWNFGSDNQETIPEKDAVNEALKHIDYHFVEIKDSKVRLADSKAQIDLGFIAKGFIADKIKEFLISQKISCALINLGGNVVTLGCRPDGSPFKVGIRNPFQNDGEPLLTVDATDLSVVSSGDYERFFEKDGRLYHHILSTQTGYPADSGLSQVTILSSDSTTGDALSTLCFLLGYEKAALFLKNYPDVQAIFVTKDGEILYAGETTSH